MKNILNYWLASLVGFAIVIWGAFVHDKGVAIVLVFIGYVIGVKAGRAMQRTDHDQIVKDRIEYYKNHPDEAIK
jgi:hypothetical protein